jgi:hypothetical protein
MMTCSRPLEDWGKLLEDVLSAAAILGRVLQDAEIVAFQGRSFRLRNRYERRSKSASHNSAAMVVRRIAVEPLFPPAESEARGVYADMEIWTEVRRRGVTGELSKRVACREYGLSWRTLEKMRSHVEPPGYRR